MTDADDNLRTRYRELGSPEPPAALDQAILASARRAVAPRASQRWAMPVSVAAVLVLAVGVTLRMQQEQPGIESAVPNEYSAPPPAPAPEPPPSAPARELQSQSPAAPPPASEPAPAAKATAPIPPASQMRQRAADDAAPGPAPGAKLGAEAKVEAQAKVEAEAKVEVKKEKADRNQADPKPFADAVAPATTAPPMTAPPPGERPAFAEKPQRMERSAASPALGRTAPPAVAAAPASPPAPVAQSEPAAKAESRRDLAADNDAQRGKRAAAAGAPADLAKEAADPKEKELQRIAQLRRDGRHAEADEALRIFRRDHPEYRIPDALWEQVKPR